MIDTVEKITKILLAASRKGTEQFIFRGEGLSDFKSTLKEALVQIEHWRREALGEFSESKDIVREMFTLGEAKRTLEEDVFELKKEIEYYKAKANNEEVEKFTPVKKVETRVGRDSKMLQHTVEAGIGLCSDLNKHLDSAEMAHNIKNLHVLKWYIETHKIELNSFIDADKRNRG